MGSKCFCVRGNLFLYKKKEKNRKKEKINEESNRKENQI